jgi:hypothetical protein
MKEFHCSVCEYSTSSKYCLDRHFGSKKHEHNVKNPNENSKKLHCVNCNRKYKENSGLWKHLKICKKSGMDEPAKHDIKDTSNNNEILEEIKKLNMIISELKQNQTLSTTINNNNSNTTNNNFNINVFLNESCSNAVNLDDFIKKLIFDRADSKIMINNYVEGTCSIIKKNLEKLPINKRPLHYLEGEDPHQQLMHIRQDDKWNIDTELNWMQQIHADDDDDVLNKNPIYYAIKKIDDEKLKYLGYFFHQDKEYIMQHGRLHREISRPDFKEKVYRKLIKMIKLDPEQLDQAHLESEILISSD